MKDMETELEKLRQNICCVLDGVSNANKNDFFSFSLNPRSKILRNKI